ncbi:peptidoglycan D,D-transpeptidase FtsI family protein [Bacillus sp. FJAT-44742]|uniref:peptidoglycan D,D-transpeptidase FtsI family protein n=1 Tax=Bacillus sp. FJAT-44742 TaxID=2014005 RepID=UPI000C247048|nr:penicillin-binding protein 2 [Bacillus sp. FJAT-44742]
MPKLKQKKNHVPYRLNVLFFGVFILFSALILRLGFVQIVEGENYIRDLEGTNSASARIDAPRGLMYDRHGNIAVNNELVLSLTYTNRPGVSNEERIEVAERLSEFIEVDIDKVTDRDLRDFWLITNEEEAQELITPEELSALEDNELYQLQLERIPDGELESFSQADMKVAAIWREMTGGYHHSPHRVKQGIEVEEAHQISERLDELPGVDLYRDAQRNYVYGDTFPRFFGSTGSIPREGIDSYLARGYDRSDEVGTSFLESQYEEVLRGQKGVLEAGSGNLANATVENPGKRGNDLVLTLDMELQQEVENIIKEEVESSQGTFINDPEAYVVMMEPQTGDILSIAGYGDHLGAVSRSFEAGSTVKAATVAVGLETEVIQPGSIIHDRPISLPQTPTMRSVRNMGSINELTALERSSNIYMAEIAMRMAGYDYGRECCWEDVEGAYQTFRNYFNQFGLGIETGIDLPSESTGIVGSGNMPGNLLYLSFGQFDTYTPLQLAQYISTIANDGYRMQPRLVKEIRQPSEDNDSLGPISSQLEPKVLNRVDIQPEYLDRVQEGLWRVMNGSQGTARSHFSSANYVAAGKTGTAQISVRSDRTGNVVQGNNQALVGYAPYENPEVAFAVIVPYVQRDTSGGRTGLANTIARKSLDAYFELKEERPHQLPEETNEETLEDPEDFEEFEELEELVETATEN